MKDIAPGYLQKAWEEFSNSTRSAPGDSSQGTGGPSKEVTISLVLYKLVLLFYLADKFHNIGIMSSTSEMLMLCQAQSKCFYPLSFHFQCFLFLNSLLYGKSVRKKRRIGEEKNSLLLVNKLFHYLVLSDLSDLTSSYPTWFTSSEFLSVYPQNMESHLTVFFLLCCCPYLKHSPFSFLPTKFYLSSNSSTRYSSSRKTVRAINHSPITLFYHLCHVT